MKDDLIRNKSHGLAKASVLFLSFLVVKLANVSEIIDHLCLYELAVKKKRNM
jgi:hypothetical protein